MAETQKAEPAQVGRKKRGRKKAGPPQRRRRRAKELVEQVIEKMEQKLKSEEVKPSVGDLIRLLQLEKELEEEQPKEIKVSWVEPREEEHAGDG